MCLPSPDYQRFKTYNGLHVYIPSSEALDDKPGYEYDLARMDTIRNTQANKRRLAAMRLAKRLHHYVDVFPALRAQSGGQLRVKHLAPSLVLDVAAVPTALKGEPLSHYVSISAH